MYRKISDFKIEITLYLYMKKEKVHDCLRQVLFHWKTSRDNAKKVTAKNAWKELEINSLF